MRGRRKGEMGSKKRGTRGVSDTKGEGGSGTERSHSRPGTENSGTMGRNPEDPTRSNPGSPVYRFPIGPFKPPSDRPSLLADISASFGLFPDPSGQAFPSRAFRLRSHKGAIGRRTEGIQPTVKTWHRRRDDARKWRGVRARGARRDPSGRAQVRMAPKRISNSRGGGTS